MININNVKDKLIEGDLIYLSPIYSDKGKFFVIKKEIQFITTWGHIYIIPKGFITDLCTVPKWLWHIFPPFGNYLIAYIIHDFLYIGDRTGLNRLLVDQEMLRWANVVHKNKWDNKIRYAAVRIFGWLYWKKIISFKVK